MDPYGAVSSLIENNRLTRENTEKHLIEICSKDGNNHSWELVHQILG